MKCENCGKNEVTFIYQSNINGQVTEKHLCSECAQKLGYAQRAAAYSRHMLQNFSSLFGDGGLFSLVPGFMGRLLEDPFDDMFSDMPALGAPVQQQEKREDFLLGEEEQNRFACQRELNALKMELKQAVQMEEFERAAQLRDQIREMEKERF